MNAAGAGDKLARGAARAQFPPAEGISDEKWNNMFGDFDPEKYRRDADSEKTRDVSAESGAIKETCRI
jgi:hypothetical protein